MKPTMYKILLLILLSVALVTAQAGTMHRGHHTTAAADTTVNPYFELAHIVGVLNNDSIYTVNQYRWRDIADSFGGHTYITDTISFTMQDNNYQMVTDTLEQVQNDLYNVTVDNTDSIIIIGVPQLVYPIVMQTDLLDSTLHQVYLDSMFVRDSGIARILTAVFHLSSPYYYYAVGHDAAVDWMSIKYKMRNHIPLTPDTAYTITEPTIDYTQLVMSVYLTIPSVKPTDPFSTDKYFTQVGSNFVLKPAYSGYQIINTIGPNP